MTEAFEDDVRAGLRKNSKRRVPFVTAISWRSAILTPPARTPDQHTIDEFLNRGRNLWKTIYTPHDEKLYAKLGSYHPDFIGM